MPMTLTTEHRDLWLQAKAELTRNVTPATAYLHIAPLRLLGVQGDCFVVELGPETSKSWADRQMRRALLRKLRRVAGYAVDVQFVKGEG